jgi:heat shock protein HtpX
MATLYTHQDANARRTWFLILTFVLVVVGVAWFFSYVLESPVILYVAIVFSLVMNIIGYWYSDKIVLSLTGAKPVSREEYWELYNIVENLAITAGLPMPKIYIIKDIAPNAFATGRDKNHAVVAVTTGLLDMMSRTELEGVVAHELAHIGNRDILLQTIVVVLVGFLVLLSDLFIRMSLFGRGGSSNRGGGGAKLVVAVLGIVLALLAPVIAKLIQLAISRRREFLADATGALLTRYPEGLASALEKIGNYKGGLTTASGATAHLFIANPLGQSGQKGFKKMFLTHPPIEDRIKALRGNQA